ncbi:MAG: hypothetical protein M0C28_12720 [Candidatus Moduliflexus flocculans]|nr:hypothetical protein [Candidatus Moduliflexus flocculans]
MSTRTGVCNFCGTGCGHLLEVGDGAVRGVFASPGHPVSRGRLCVRGWHIHELLATRRADRRRPPSGPRRPPPAGRLRRGPRPTPPSGSAGYSGGEIAFLASPRASNEDNFLHGPAGPGLSAGRPTSAWPPTRATATPPRSSSRARAGRPCPAP